MGDYYGALGWDSEVNQESEIATGNTAKQMTQYIQIRHLSEGVAATWFGRLRLVTAIDLGA